MSQFAILVVDDDPITQKMVRETREAAGYAVLAAEEGQSAVGLAASSPVDLVLLDFVLPDMEGFEVARRLRALPGGSGLPIVLFSGFLSKLLEAQRSQLGFGDYLFEPVEPSRLLQIVQTRLPAGEERGRERAEEGLAVLVAHVDPAREKIEAER